jgi:hypothetical protein
VEVWELIARESIRDLVARYNANGDAGRFDAMLALFAEGAELEVEGDVHAGHDAIRRLFEGVARETRQRAAPLLRHFTATHQIDVRDARTASGRSYFLVLTEDGLDHWGRYADAYVCEDAAWRFARRSVRVEGRVPGGFADRAS